MRLINICFLLIVICVTLSVGHHCDAGRIRHHEDAVWEV